MNKRKQMRIGCLHAHHSNIRYVEEALTSEGTELLHFVDPGLIHRLTGREAGMAEAAAKVKEQLAWIEGSGVEAIIITCTNYIALLDASPDPAEHNRSSIPVIPIDEPWFDDLLDNSREAVLAFTNPATVEGTMERLRKHAAAKGAELNAVAAVADHCFQLLLQGRAEAYDEKVESFLQELIRSRSEKVVVTQLSMTEAARRVERSLGVELIQPVSALQRRFKHIFVSS
ncbi:aspartate/glutamate racemase family protein [Paenibacillus allorhizosphaerae]|uniref:Asp/Glu racemase n=1 Tax=Paenibacillus allorhizosphaerae TaxID=2849866 RepID=A0ABM8VHS1_9BACL|nr:aspartate/glutamate racemase family protein [Paenibacillus allorhizosphaerae]CAG7642559.1 hypothetical protein PAECIP111802_02874 [Paenibacillus allorhizosphaerae]